MAFSRIGTFNNLAILSWPKNKATSTFGKIQHSNKTRIVSLHAFKVSSYPEAPVLPLPTNISEIFANETGRFTPERARDITTPVLIHSSSNHNQFLPGSKTFFDVNELNWTNSSQQDSHIASYDCFGAVSLNSSMQTNVPEPFNSTGKSTHLNMPGGQWARDGKYIAEDMQKAHFKFQLLKNNNKKVFNTRNYTTSASGTKISETKSSETKSSDTKSSETENPKLIITKKERFKILVKDYGYTVTIFHIGISLMSLGACYIAVSSGIDMTSLVKAMTDNNNKALSSIMASSSTFALAYGVHKLLAPIRLAITFTFVPFIVRYLRRKGILKHPKVLEKLRKAKLKSNENP